MKWSNYVAVVDEKQASIVRAVSVKHALYKITQQFPDAQRHEVIKCRCAEVNNDMCDAHYIYWTYHKTK